MGVTPWRFKSSPRHHILTDFPNQRFRALYLHNELGRIQALNQWDGGDAPRFHLMRTAQTNRWRFRSDLPLDLVKKLEALCRSEPISTPSNEAPRLMAEAITLLDAGAPIEVEWQGPIFKLGDMRATESRAETRSITPENAWMLEAGMPDWLPDVPHRAPFLATVMTDRVVAVCASVRITDHVHEAGVETWEKFRRRGFARDAVTAWANAVHATGALPIYSTSWDNVGSQGVARSLGATLIGTDFHIR